MPRKLPPIDFHDLHRRCQSGERTKDVAADAGIGLTTLYRHWRKLGLSTRPRRPKRDWKALYRRYQDGESSSEIAESIGITPASLRKGFRNRGFEMRSLSEAKTLDMARRTAAERKAITAAANEAVRGRSHSFAEKCKRAVTVEERQLHVSPHDTAMRDMLGGGTLQKAIGPYNCDVAFESVAVELFGGSWHASGRAARRHPERCRHILDAGWHLVIVWVEERRHPLSVEAADYVVALHERLSGDPTATRQYRVIRGAAEELVIGCADDDEFPMKLSRGGPVQIRCEHHR